MKNYFLILIISFSIFNFSLAQRPVYQGQATAEIIDTKPRPVDKHWRGTFSLDNGAVFFNNDFEGGRLNGVAQISEDTFHLLIGPENVPINPSPWYAFKIWSITPREVVLNFSFVNSRARYFPKTSYDGLKWEALDSSSYVAVNPGTEDFGYQSIPESMILNLSVDSKPLWISAQELQTSTHVAEWIAEMAVSADIDAGIMDTTLNGRNIPYLKIGNTSKEVIVIISRQHPPEVTGYLCMKAFVEEIAGDSKLAKQFRKKYGALVFPIMNPDGVDEGHWRHNYGGIDLNRDWANRNQTETASLHRFLQQRKSEGLQFQFAIDFHSTWDDIYYPIDATLMGDRGAILYKWLDAMDDKIPDYIPNIKPGKTLDPPMISSRYFFSFYNMPSLVFELGDNTPRDFLALKGQIAAQELMRLMLAD